MRLAAPEWLRSAHPKGGGWRKWEGREDGGAQERKCQVRSSVSVQDIVRKGDMESEEEQHTTTLLCMGFADPGAIRKALRLAKNDINEAVALLTNERPGLDYGGYEPMDSGGPRGDSGEGGRGGRGGFDPPPAYHEVVDSEVRRSSCGFCSEIRKKSS
ncbi:hypothetical protein NDU88_002231 [Pleurodeles waltl]|uniref:UBA domain-containing protein n=1 Tax=Pleurodeles waltl TaxID=8319 RepID=A0AAV7T1U2_PLEWA|nr:hypothetical protein NDU88_002231 [Pleurodeles waltl]